MQVSVNEYKCKSRAAGIMALIIAPQLPKEPVAASDFQQEADAERAVARSSSMPSMRRYRMGPLRIEMSGVTF